MSTPELTRVLEAAIESHQPPLVSGRRINLRYAHQGGRNPPVIVIHGNQTDHVPDAYRRYLVNVYRKAFDLMGTPVRVAFRGEENPFAGKRNPLTPRQVRKRKRLIQRNKREYWAAVPRRDGSLLQFAKTRTFRISAVVALLIGLDPNAGLWIQP